MSKDLRYVVWLVLLGWNAYNFGRIGLGLLEERRHPIMHRGWVIQGYVMLSFTFLLVVVSFFMVGWGIS